MCRSAVLDITCTHNTLVSALTVSVSCHMSTYVSICRLGHNLDTHNTLVSAHTVSVSCHMSIYMSIYRLGHNLDTHNTLVSAHTLSMDRC